jgi:hypothetical protein
MELAPLKVRFRHWGPWVAGFFLAAAVVVPHAALGSRAVYAFGLAASLVALEYVWSHLTRGVRGESVAAGVVLGALFFGVVDGVGLANGAAGPLLFVLAALASAATFRPTLPQPEPVGTRTRIVGMLVVLASMWATIMMVRMLQRWPPW